MNNKFQMLQSLKALSYGDAVGEVRGRLSNTVLSWTDDTAMACAIAKELVDNETIHPESLAKRFGNVFLAAPERGYGKMAKILLPKLAANPWEWETLSKEIASWGNGAAMRIAPLGCYFSYIGDVVNCAEASAKVTHYSTDGIAGAIAVAVAAHLITYTPASKLKETFLPVLWSAVPVSGVRDRLLMIPDVMEQWQGVESYMSVLGRGSQSSALDTVPSMILAAYDTAIRGGENMMHSVDRIAQYGGDSDTNCAIYCGILGGRYYKRWDWKGVEVEPLLFDLELNYGQK